MVLVKFCDSDPGNPAGTRAGSRRAACSARGSRGLARILVLPMVSRARMKPVMLLETKPNLMPLVGRGEAGRVGEPCPPRSCRRPSAPTPA